MGTHRPKRLTFIAGFNARGEPRMFYQGVPARDLDERDLAKLSDERIAEIQGGPYPVYLDPDAAGKPAKEPVKEAGKPAEGPVKGVADGAAATV